MARSSRRERADDGLRQTVGRIIELRRDAIRISPGWVATEAMILLDGTRVSPALVYLGCHLQLRQIAREMLRGKYEPDAEADEDAQHSLWPALQKRYPTFKSNPGDDPEYVVLEELTAVDVGFNLRRLRSEAQSKQEHADALEAWWRGRGSAAA